MKQLEKDILEEANSILAVERPRLQRNGLDASRPELTCSNEGHETYTSEIVIQLMRDGDIDDVLEFFIFKDGEPNVSFEEAEAWLRAELKALGKD